MLFSSILFTTAIGFAASVYAAPSHHGQKCGRKGGICPPGEECIPKNPYCTNLERCSGRCVPQLEPFPLPTPIRLPPIIFPPWPPLSLPLDPFTPVPITPLPEPLETALPEPFTLTEEPIPILEEPFPTLFPWDPLPLSEEPFPFPEGPFPEGPFPTPEEGPRNEYPSCGGFRVTPVNCPDGSYCADDPRNPFSCGMACDAPGICIPKTAQICGALANVECPDGLTCYDYPSDNCDPRSGGEYCVGICL